MTLELKNISYPNIIDNISFKLKEGDNLSIIGNIASGKSTICNILAGKISVEGYYYIDEKLVDNKVVSNNVFLVSNSYLYDNESVVDIFFDELEDEELIKKNVKYFAIDKLLNVRIDDLKKEDRYYILLILALLSGRKFIVIDDVLCYLKNKYIDKIYKYANKNNISIINVASTLDNVLFSDYVIFLYNGSTSYCQKYSYNTGNYNLLGRSGQTSFNYSIIF